MISTELALFALGIVAFLDVPHLLKHGQRRELIVFWSVLGIAFSYCLAAAFRWEFLNPTRLIEALFQPLGQTIFGG